MACALNVDQIKDLYGALYGEIIDRINDTTLPKFNINNFVKELYAELTDPTDPIEEEKALLYIQAVPDIFLTVSRNNTVRDYIIENEINLNDVLKLSKKFESPDLKGVKEEVAIKKKSVKEIKISIEKINEAAKNLSLIDPETNTKYKARAGQNKARVTNSLSTTPQQAVAENPETLTEEQRNKIDEEKAMFYTVIKNIAYLANAKDPAQTDVEYNSIPIRLKPVVTSTVDPSNFTVKDRPTMVKYPDGLVAFVADTDGNILYFDEEGVITTKDQGRPVYQYIRKVNLKNNKLLLSNRADFYYTLVSPEEQVEQMRQNAIRNKITFTEVFAKSEVRRIKAEQKKDLNALYNLREFVTGNPNTEVLLPITGGSTGFVETTYKPLVDTDITEDEITDYFVEDAGSDRGMSYFILSRTKAGAAIDTPVYMQRGDITQEIAQKIAKVLTTDAKIAGEELNPYQREKYAKVFLDNRVYKNRINITVEQREGIPKLIVTVFETESDAVKNRNGVEITTEEEIVNHLLNAVKVPSKSQKGAFLIYPANLSYNKEYIGGKSFVDYTITGNKISSSDVPYFNYIKPHIKIEFSKDSFSFFAGFNAYLTFAVPDVIKPADQEYEPGFVIDKTQGTKKTKQKEEAKTPQIKLSNDKIKITVAKKYGLSEATTQAVKSADGVLSFAIDFDTSAEKLVKRVSTNYYGVTLDTKKNAPKNLTPSAEAVNNIVSNINKFSPGKLFISGSNIAELTKAGYTQDEIDTYMANILDKVTKSDKLSKPITQVITTGQTGIAEAFTKAAANLDITARVIAPKTYTYITASKNAKEGYKFESDKEGFISRFGTSPETEPTPVEILEGVDEPKIKRTRKERKTTTRKKPVTIEVKGVTVESKPVEQKLLEDKVKLVSPIDAILGAVPPSLLPPKDLKRAKDVGRFLDSIFTTKVDKAKADEWYAKTFGGFEKIMPLERITAIVNSDAYATWSKNGITLYEGDGGTSVDLYHEAWHGFSQLFLTYDEKVDLYTHMRTEYPKWANADFEEIEESIAEDFRSFMKFKKKFPGIIGRIFEKIAKILRKIFGKLTRRDFTLPRDIPMVREMFDTLYKGDLSSYSPNVKNAMPEFTVLNRAKTIQLPKSQKDNFQEWTLAETVEINETIDSIFAMTFRNYAKQYNAPAAVDHILTNPTNRKAMYTSALQKLEALRQGFIDQLSAVTLENLESETPNTFLEAQLMQKVDLLNKTVEGFGDIDLSLEEKQNTGVIAYHIKNSRFNILKRAFMDLEDEDASNIAMSQAGRDQNDNNKSSKEYASEETMMLLSSISEETGKTDANGEPIYVLNSLGVPKLQDPDVLWSRLSRILAGTMDPDEMYSLMIKYQENYPEFRQILTLLPNPIEHPEGYNSNSEFDAETKFWQDLKKPIVKFKQLTINKTIVERGGEDETGRKRKEKAAFESRVSRASFDTYGIINDWTTNFIVASPKTNPYITQKDNVNVLNTNKLLSELAPNGVLPARNTVKFLNALGINLDMNSYQINSIVNDPRIPFNSMYGINNILNVIQIVHEASQSKDSKKKAEAEKFKRNPMYYLRKGLDKSLQPKQDNNESVSGKIRLLAELQNEYSDGYSNFSTLTPEGNKVWEHFLDSTITRVITSINKAANWQELTDPKYDVNGRFKHMRWLAEANNPHSRFSVLLNSIFYLDKLDPNYGNKRPDSELALNIVGGTQVVTKDKSSKEGTSTSSADLTTKFLQELHTMLSSGVEEFMRHASKNTAMSLSTKKVLTYGGKDNDGLYVDTKLFRPSSIMLSGNMGESQAFVILSGYLAGEFDRIRRFKANSLNKDLNPDQKFENWTGYNRKLDNGKMAGEVFTAFDDVLLDTTKQELYNIIDEMVKTGDNSSLLDYFETNEALRSKIKAEVIDYFDKETDINIARLKKAKYLDPALYEDVSVDGLTVDQVEEMMVKSYTYNSWMHKFETTIIAYGDVAQYNHAKEEFHKRNAGLASGGRGFRADMRAQMFINNRDNFRRYYAEREGYTIRKYDGTLNTAVLQEKKLASIYYDEYYDILVDDYTKRLKKSKIENPEAEARKMAKTALEEYEKMKEADGQGHITFESYRMLKKLESSWSDEQEALYRKIARGEQVEPADVIQFFPPYKLQYFGNIQVQGLPLTSFHKFSLAPIIPSVHTMDTNLGKLHDMMMKQQIDYVLFESGSKVGHVTTNGSGDPLYNSDKETINTDLVFTPNVVFAEFLKNQTEINKEYKKKSIFSTQLRKLILEGLYEQGKIDSTDEDKITEPTVLMYINRVQEYTNLLKEDLLNEIGFELRDGEYVPVDANSNAKLLELIRGNLDRDDVLGDHLIDLIDINEDGTISYDLSIHPEAAKIEKVLLSIINKRIIKQKVKGEPLVQVSGAMYEGIFNNSKYKKGTDADIKKFVGTNFLPTYHRKADGTTAAMKTMVALQGDFLNLLNLEYKGKPIETIDRLNEAIKDDQWLDTNDNRKSITMVGVRIPVQGLNSMEFMEVYHFLPAEAGNIIIPPAEIVAKSGGDFDIDKMTVFMPNIMSDGTYVKRVYEDLDAVKAEVADVKAQGKTGKGVFNAQKAALENELIEDIKAILELPSNYPSLITPNGTFLLKGIADQLSEFVMDYNPFQNRTNPQTGKSLSPTRIFESEYNLYKHVSNVVGKRTLGLGAIENTFNVVFNSLGASMPRTFMHGEETEPRNGYLWLKHNTMTKDGEKVISLSNRYDADNVNKIADIFSQMINGWVDVEKDAWIFFIQGNYEVAPILLYLIKAGVPAKDAIYFVSQPLVREYVDEQRLIKSTYADPLRRKTDMPVKYSAASNVISNHFEKPETLKKGRARYNEAVRLSEEYFKDGKEMFTQDEMLSLIEDSKKDPKAADSELSRLMFLHYLQIEQQVQGITQLKMNSNPDTSTDSTLFESEETLANLEALETESKLDKDLFTSMLSDSIISSFFNQKMALGISKPLFPLRYHPALSSFLIDLSKNRKLRDYAKATFGEGKEDVLASVFRNDLISYIFQNALRKYKLSDSYRGYEMTNVIPVSLVDELNFGAYVKTDDKGNKTLYVDKKKLRKEFESDEWMIGSDSKNSYESRKLFPLMPGHFKNNNTTNFDEYTRFVAEREYLRDMYPIAEYRKTADFDTELTVTQTTKPNMSEQDQVRYTYERFLANKALENTFNPYHLFKDPNYSMAAKFNNIIKKYPDLAKEYKVLQKLKVDSAEKLTMFNIYLADREMSNGKANLYHADLANLADPSVAKVGDTTDNMIISDFFTKLSVVAFLQTGLNKSKFSFTNIADIDNFVSIMQQEGNKFVKLLDNPAAADTILNNYFYDLFLNENNSQKKNSNRFKNYLSNLDFDNLKTLKTTTTTQISTVVKPKGTINVYWGQAESATSTKILSNLAPRKFTWKGREYGSVEHAYQANKSGTFDQNTYDAYNNLKEIPGKQGPGFGTKIRGKAVTQGFDNLQLMRNLVVESFKQNANSEAANKLLQYENFTHNTNEIIDKAFLEGLKLAQKSLLPVQQFTTPIQKTNETTLEPLSQPGIVVFKNSSKSPKHYQDLLKVNPDTVFFTNEVLAKLANENLSFGGETILADFSDGMSIRIPTSYTRLNDNLQTLPEEEFERAIERFERRITTAKQILYTPEGEWTGAQIAFSDNGYGDPTKMPQKLFVYLSRRLYEEFGYLNPGSSQFEEIEKIVIRQQGISDQEIINKFDSETSDPFNCT